MFALLIIFVIMCVFDLGWIQNVVFYLFWAYIGLFYTDIILWLKNHKFRKFLGLVVLIGIVAIFIFAVMGQTIDMQDNKFPPNLMFGLFSIVAMSLIILGIPLIKKGYECICKYKLIRKIAHYYLRSTVRSIVRAIAATNEYVRNNYPVLSIDVEDNVFFVTSQELEDMYPDLTPKQRETAITREHGTVFIMQIGKKLKSGNAHDGRAPDYDDWELNGDILVWDELLGIALELSSMGIRVDSEALDRQLTLAGCDDRRSLTFHQKLLNGELPLTIGGGIGQSRLCMFMLEKAHIGEVQASVWDEETIIGCREAGIPLL